MKPIRLESTGRIVQVDSQGKIALMYDAHGRATRDRFTSTEMREFREAVAAEAEASAMDLAVTAPQDPRFREARDLIVSSTTPEEQRVINSHAPTFNRVFSRAREAAGMSDAEFAEAARRRDRIEELEGRFQDQAEGPHGKSQNLADVAELMALRQQERSDG